MATAHGPAVALGRRAGEEQAEGDDLRGGDGGNQERDRVVVKGAGHDSSGDRCDALDGGEGAVCRGAVGRWHQVGDEGFDG